RRRWGEGLPGAPHAGAAQADIAAGVADLRNTLFLLAAILTVSILLVTLFLLVQHRTAERLRAALALNRNFLARVSHELRTPLNAILGFSEVIRDQMLGPQAGGRYADYAHDIHESGRHLLGLINDIMDLSRLQAGTLSLHREDLDVAPVVDWAFRMVAPQADAKAIRLDMHVEPGHHSVSADERALKQMLLNLLTNAVTFTPDGGRILVTVGGGADGGCRVRVTDNGIGMTPEQLHQAAEPFGQPAVHVALPGQGGGLGLSIVKSLMEAHGGRLRIDSRPGEGSQFTLEFAA
ncbi:two-component sensor histidine kinase, partial [Azospirillum brasilense]|nr:two-component sensor histidine kinase [Azospirillum brasilense]